MRRVTGALQAVIGTIISVITLPFRVLSRLIGGGGGAGRRTHRTGRRPAA
ncbi:LPFR motif small protein [Actinomadura viridis]|uniref:Uncharacterized protein n=1 Tax=Actinomadura viridis TaxID=58110 RepID=A0A931DNB8_9ACTN|nr:LPFR motif small protein [Actinomadura viridis]MBG6090746.1 hypothetical protein [Actinomadura viridis]